MEIGRTLRRMFLRFYRNLIITTRYGRLPDLESFIIIANHRTGADPVILEASLNKDIYFMVDAQFFRSKFYNFIFDKIIGGFPGSSSYPFLSLKGILRAIRILKGGGIVGIFPEGVMIRDRRIRLGEFKPGAAYISIRTGKPILPVFIHNSIPGPLPSSPTRYDLEMEGFYSVMYNIGNKVHLYLGDLIYPEGYGLSKSDIFEYNNLLFLKMRELINTVLP